MRSGLDHNNKGGSTMLSEWRLSLLGLGFLNVHITIAMYDVFVPSSSPGT